MHRSIGIPHPPATFVVGCQQIHRSYIHTATNGLPSRGTTLAAAAMPMPLTANSSSPVSITGATCLNQSTSTRSDSFITIGQRSNRLSAASHPWSPQCSLGPMPTPTSPATHSGTLPTSCRRATSASISRSCVHGSLDALRDMPSHHFDAHARLPRPEVFGLTSKSVAITVSTILADQGPSPITVIDESLARPPIPQTVFSEEVSASPFVSHVARPCPLGASEAFGQPSLAPRAERSLHEIATFRNLIHKLAHVIYLPAYRPCLRNWPRFRLGAFPARLVRPSR